MKSSKAHPIDLVVAERVKGLAADREMSMRTVASNVGMTQATMSRRVNGLSNWRYTEVAHLARFFGVSVAYMVGEDQ